MSVKRCILRFFAIVLFVLGVQNIAFAATNIVTLDPNGGNGGTESVTATQGEPMPPLSALPTRTGYEFSAYKDSDGRAYYGNAGQSNRNWDKTEDTTLYADWSAIYVNCNAGYYMPADTTLCKPCPSGYYCPNAGQYTIKTYDQGKTQCPKGAYSDAGATKCTLCESGTTTDDSYVGCKTCPNANGAKTWKTPTLAREDTGAPVVFDKCAVAECKDGYTFIATNNDNIATSNNLCDIETYTITYELDGGTNNSNNPTTYTVESPTIILAEPTRPGYTFAGWHSNADLTDTAVSEIPTGSTGNKIFYAAWAENLIFLRFYHNDKVAYEGRCYYGQRFTTPQISAPAGYHYDGGVWYLGATAFGFNQTYDCNYDTLGIYEGGTDFYGDLVANQYTIVYEKNGGTGTMSNQARVYGDNKKLNANTFTRNGYTFDGWNTREDGTGTSYSDQQAVNIPTTGNEEIVYIYAQWSECPAGYYCPGDNLKHACPMGSYSDTGAIKCEICVGKTTSKIGATYCDAECPNKDNVATWGTPTLDKDTEGYDFVYEKCFITSCETGYELTGTNAPTASYSFTCDLAKYTITYELNGGENNDLNLYEYTVNDDTVVLYEPTRDGYKFMGWYSNPDFTGVNQMTIYKGSTGNKTFYAKWEQNYIELYTEYNGNRIYVGRCDQGLPCYAPVNTYTNTGYDFIGWGCSGINECDALTEENYFDGTSGYGEINEVFGNWSNIYPGDIITLIPQWKKQTVTCDAGYYLPANATKCEVCGLGAYCTGGTYEIKTTDQGRESCPVAFPYTDIDNTSDSSKCYNTCTSNCTPVILCPENATCENLEETTTGKIFNTGFPNCNAQLTVCNTTIQCNDGYTLTDSNTCEPNTYTLTYDCGAQGAFTGTSADRERYITYNTSFNVGGSLCSKTGYELMEWTDSTGQAMAVSALKQWTYTTNQIFTARWSPNAYNLAFDSNGGGGSMNAISQTYDEEYKLPANSFTRTGYVFTGWNTMADGTGTGYANMATIKNLATEMNDIATLYAQWSKCQAGYYCPGDNTQKACPDGYNLSDTGANSAESCYKTCEQPCISKTLCPDNANCTTDTSATTSGIEYYNSTQGCQASIKTCDMTITCNTGYELENKTCKPITYIIRFYANDGTSNYTDITRTYDDLVALGNAGISRPGYQLVGWGQTAGADQDDENILGTEHTGNLPLPEDRIVKLYAIYEEINCDAGYTRNDDICEPNEITIQYRYSGGVYDTQTCTYGETFDLSNKTPTGYWFESGLFEVSGKFHSLGTPIICNHDNLGVYSGTAVLFGDLVPNTCTVRYHHNDGTNEYTDVPRKYDDSKGLITGLTRAGYTFAGWNTQADLNGTQYLDGELVPFCELNDHTYDLYAKWTANEYTITLDDNGATESGTTILYTRYGDGVYLDAERTKKLTTNSNSIEIPEKYWSITYNANGGSAEKSDDRIPVPFTSYSLSSAAAYSKSYINNNGFITADGVSVAQAITENTTWYAKWDTNRAAMTPITLPEATRTGYTLYSWYTDIDGTKKVVGNAGDSYTTTGGDVTLYAHWNAVKYTITYEENGGSDIDDKTYYITSNTFSLPTPIRDGYTFGGWYSNAELSGESVTEIPTGSTGDKTFWAKWTANNYFIEYDNNCNSVGSGNMSTGECSYDTDCQLTQNAFSCTGYTFNGWNTAADGSGDSYTDKESVKILTNNNNETVTLYAQWTPITCGAGQYLGGNECAECPAGSYCPGDNTEIACPAPYSNSVAGSTSQDQCYKICDDGYGVNGKDDSYAQYGETCKPYYMTIQYTCSDCDGGNAPTAPDRCEYGTVCKLPENTYEKTGYMFDKWNVECQGCIAKQRILGGISSVQMSAGEDISQFISSTNTGGSFTISPTWNKAIYSVNLVYSSSGGEGDVPTEPTTCTSDAPCTLPENTYTKSGYVFNKWQLECDGCGENGTIDVNVGDNISQYITSLNNGKDINISPIWTECAAGSYCPGDNTQQECPNDGQSNTGASSVTECYAIMDCNVGGNGKNTCYWNSWNKEYIDNCTTCKLEECDEGFDLVGTKCKLSNPEFTIETIDMAPGAEFKFEVQIEGTYYVDWGDGSDTEKIEIPHDSCINKHYVSHTYTDGGVHTIGMSGQAVSYNVDNTGQNECEYTQFVCVEYRRLTFANNTNIAKLGGSLGAVFGIENQKAIIPYLFENCTNLTEIPKTLFDGFYGLRSYAAISGFQSLFAGCTSLKSIPDGLFDGLYANNASDFNFTNTFAGCTSLKEIPKKLFANIPGGSASFDGTFDGCIGLSEIPEELFLNINIGGYNQFRNTFANCAGLKSIPENLFSTINGEVSSGMFDATFKNCTGLTSLPNSLFKNLTGKPKEWTDLGWCDSASGSFASTFAGCTNLRGYIPADMFEKLDSAGFDPLSMEDIFNNTALATVCPDGAYQYITGFESAWDGKVACKPCPESHPYSDAGNNGTINQCYTTCTTDCVQPSTCPVNNASCVYKKDTSTGTEYFNETCNAIQQTCGVESFTCNDGYQKNDADNGCVAKTYDIIYKLNDGTNNATNPDSYTIESETIVLAAPTRDGYIFAGWTENGTSITQITKGTTGNKTLVANWNDCGKGNWCADGVKTACTEYGAEYTTDSVNATKAEDCYKPCEIACTEQTCPNNATCTPGETSTSGKQYYGSTCNAAASTCSLDFTCNENFEKVDGACKLIPEFTMTTTNIPQGGEFEFGVSAGATLYIDWGDGSAVEKRVTNAGDYQRIAHKYTTAGPRTIHMAGQATAYTTQTTNIYITSGIWATTVNKAVIEFISNKYLKTIDGSLGKIFGTLSDGTQPSFAYLFDRIETLEGKIPETLFDGVYGQPIKGMFAQIFSYCKNLKGPIPSGLFKDIKGTPTDALFFASFSNCENLEGEIHPDLFAGISGEATEALFNLTFKNCPKLSGEIHPDLFAGISGAPAPYMFYSTFADCSGLSGEIHPDLFAGISGAPAPYMFAFTFYNASGLTGTLSEKLFENISGAPAPYMFTQIFYGCENLEKIDGALFKNIYGKPADNMYLGTFAYCTNLTGTIPEQLFGNINGAVAKNMYFGVFFGDKNLTGTIPANLFGKLSGKQTYMFGSAFEGCTNLSGFVPPELFAGIDNKNYQSGPMSRIFIDSGIVTQCPENYYQYITGFEVDWDGRVSCTPCPDEYPNSISGKNSTINQCYTTCTTDCVQPDCPENAECEYGSETSSGKSYHGSDSCDAAAPTCSLDFTCKAGYQKNDASNGCVTKTYDIIYKLNDGTNNATNPDSYTIESETIVLAAPTRDGYTFAGWTENGTSITQITKGTTGNKTLVAQWKRNTATCNAGYYLPANTEVCELCLENHYCSGGTFEIQNLRQGIESCPYGLTSPAGAISSSDCHAEPKLCAIDFATQAYSYYNHNTQMYGKCIVIECESGYHIELNACVSDNQPCETTNGTGIKTWNEMTEQYDACVPETCNPGYTNNGEQCVPCDNMYSDGELAVSSYVNECEIAACMYQGEKYILENNECRLICDTQDDETGHRRWDESSKRCVHECEPGYITW